MPDITEPQRVIGNIVRWSMTGTLVVVGIPTVLMTAALSLPPLLFVLFGK